MRRSLLRFVAWGGLLDRRSFLASGLGLAGASLLPARRASADAAPGGGAGPLASRLPSWMTALGRDDDAYGLPASHEAGVGRTRHEVVPGTTAFTAWHTPLADLRGIVTPNGLHFGVHHNGIPDIPPGEHALLVHGLVARPLRFTVDALLRYPMVSRVHFLECAGNTAHNALSPTPVDASVQELFGQASCAEWTGVPVSVLLAEAGVDTRATWGVAEGADGGSHARSIPLEKLLGDAMVALFQNGERLRPAQGYPMRLLLPGWQGNASVKWLHRLEITDAPAYTKDESGLYTQTLADGRIVHFPFVMGVKSVITRPSGTQVLPGTGFYEITGLAWSGHGRIARVEVSADGGETWTRA
jgi:sulfane dehydrogenase subunit SoxC